ncbi:PQQ-like beta-propeller repeat protein [Streptomyces sp. HUAS TT20]|uniref:PQQ-like beta-propeller repeat protein n=1 Tax=Streptomyces sp. HUAS TT20 TaxID=3447509 RepID=UPI0021D96F01|nr:PQQ-like beta-propeller repeat protein [Streptomyces sp. HUAS 15-9]UXY30303.1 PQQ-like beta-propeller repeat protein [Streptomyces sp. HUAS 15-9]
MSFGPPPSVFTQSSLTAHDKRKRYRKRLFGIAAAVLAVALGVFGWLLTRAGDGEPSGTHQEAAAPAADEVRDTVEKVPAAPEGQVVVDHNEEGLAGVTESHPRYAPGTWATGKILAKGVADRIVGIKVEPHYDETAWTLKLDGHICATSSHVTVDGRTAVVVQPAKRKGTAGAGICDEVVFVDLNNGKKLWQSSMPSANSAFVTNTNLTLTKGVVAVAWGEGSVAYDMKNGKQLWNSATRSKCEDQGFAGGRALLALERCGDAPDTTYQVEKLDPRTGKAQWTYKPAPGIKSVYLPSSEPPVLAVAAGDTSVTDLITLDDKGRHLATISMDSGAYDPKCGDGMGFFGVVEKCPGMVVGRSQVFVMSKDQTEIDQPENWIVAFDIKTGKTEGKIDGRAQSPVFPLRMGGDDLLVYRRSFSDIEPDAVVSWNPRTGKETALLVFSLSGGDNHMLGDPEQSDIVVERGRVFFAKQELSADPKHPKDPVLSALGVGSAG